MQFNIFYSNSKTFNIPSRLRIEGFTLSKANWTCEFSGRSEEHCIETP